ncbi:MAG: hypothetical protein JWP74_2767 [Marmoricola sp.]|nr:hypothetical protein [Marmoricola sp.]
MAAYEHQLTADVDQFVAHVEQKLLAGSVTAKLEDTYEHTIGTARMVVRVYERYSAMGGNRVSLGVSILAVDGQLAVSAITSGGSEAVFFKINTMGEDSFLQKAVDAIESFTGELPPPVRADGAVV